MNKKGNVMSKAIKMTKQEVVLETRVAIFDEKKWRETVEWLKTFSTKKSDPCNWEGRWAMVYNRVKDMSFNDVLADFKEYENHTGKYIIFPFKNQYKDYDYDASESLHDLIEEWLNEDCYDSDVFDRSYTGEHEEYMEIINLED